MHKELQDRIPISSFETVSLPHLEDASSMKDYIGFGISYIEHSSAGMFFSQSFVTFSPEHKSEFAAKIRLLSELGSREQVITLALRRTYEMLKSKEDYCRLLEENMTDEEYERASEEYDKYFYRTRQPRKQLSKEIAGEAKILLETLESELGSDEIAEMLNLDVTEVEKALQEHKLSRR